MSLSSIISNPAVGAGAASQSDMALSQLSQDYTKFMTLLVAQIQHQDPMEPVDSTQFISQVAQLTQVEQAVQTNKHIEGLRNSLALSGAMFETALIGREVTAPADAIQVGPDGASFSYELEADAASVEAIIKDASGQEVHRIRNLSGTGKTIVDVVWDGRDASGNHVGEGRYSIEMAASGGSGSYNTYASSKVMAVEYLAGGQKLRLASGGLIDSGDIIRAR